MRTGEYDGVSASGNASLRLVDGGDVDPVNTDLVSNYETVYDDLKDQPYNTVDGTNYGIPTAVGQPADVEHGRGQAGAEVVVGDPRPEGGIAVQGPDQRLRRPDLHRGRRGVPEGAQPDLGIENPYELDEDQFNAAIDLLKQQRANVGEYWSDALKQISSYTEGDSTVGTTWQYQYFTLLADNQPVAVSPEAFGLDVRQRGRAGFVPEEGATGWSDTWMISSEAKHPNCMYLWMNHIISPEANAKVAAWFGEAPAQSKSCDLFKSLPAAYFASPSHCADYHADDPAFWDRVYYWITRVADCGDDRGEECKDYNDWVSAWTEIKG